MIKTDKTLNNLNRIYRHLGTWQAVADWVGVNRATVNKWFAGTKSPSAFSSNIVEAALRDLVG